MPYKLPITSLRAARPAHRRGAPQTDLHSPSPNDTQRKRGLLPPRFCPSFPLSCFLRQHPSLGDVEAALNKPSKYCAATWPNRSRNNMANTPSASGIDPTVQLVSFTNQSIPTGGDSKIDNLNVFYNVTPRQPRPCVIVVLNTAGRRHRMDAYLHRPCPSHDSGRRLFLFWPCT